jgi:hypothetical protein
MTKKSQSSAKTTEKKDDKADDASKTQECKTAEKETSRKFELKDVLLCLLEIRANATHVALMSGCKEVKYSISVDELKAGMIDIPVKSKKDAKKES